MDSLCENRLGDFGEKVLIGRRGKGLVLGGDILIPELCLESLICQVKSSGLKVVHGCCEVNLTKQEMRGNGNTENCNV